MCSGFGWRALGDGGRGYRAIRDHFSSRFFAAATTGGNRQAPLHFIERTGATFDDVANLAFGDGIAEADVHGRRWLRRSVYT